MASAAPAIVMDDDDVGDGPMELTTVHAPDGTLFTCRYRGVPLDIPKDSCEYKKAKRLADNRASAARSRVLMRLKAGDTSVSATRACLFMVAPAVQRRAKWASCAPDA